ncbi:MAG: hypothetical protein ACREHE_06765 [Rhizomicrobium sp.]
MTRQLVEVIGRDGHVVHVCVVEMEGEDCVNAEFEEVALILAEKSGDVTRREYVHLRARCVK